jgi:hypothetical protein
MKLFVKRPAEVKQAATSSQAASFAFFVRVTKHRSSNAMPRSLIDADKPFRNIRPGQTRMIFCQQRQRAKRPQILDGRGAADKGYRCNDCQFSTPVVQLISKHARNDVSEAKRAQHRC